LETYVVLLGRGYIEGFSGGVEACLVAFGGGAVLTWIVDLIEIYMTALGYRHLLEKFASTTPMYDFVLWVVKAAWKSVASLKDMVGFLE
jgi:hypothetical protein